MSEPDAVRSAGLTKCYGGKQPIEALKGVSLTITKGKVFTLLGANGAGKTTFQRIISTQLLPTNGSAQVLGYDVVSQPGEVRKHIAVVPQDAETYDVYTPWEYAYYFSRLHGATKPEARERAGFALKTVGLWELRNKTCGSLSGGQRRRAIISSALSSNAEIFMLDEPTSGLDAVARRNVWSSLTELVRQGKTIILSTHIMEEAEMVSDRLAILNKGLVIAEGTPDQIRGLSDERFKVVFDNGGETMTMGDGCRFVKFGSKGIAYLRGEDQALELVRSALKQGLRAEASPISLEDVFVRLIGGECIEQ